ncbi:biorientation of chromosomes in cell division 1 family member [Anaeramoeba flamelloides]|uniref:Biorientation of chromosomes in cell division 1 family member n=1 Tax=Anaeramoeba flamelloides TaxID=1746091 RepID=A0ABQ8Y602_9EUKA|nr:biorientation of chromosomes in cell division 1 family member [Anaeramoeba flamelloides]
MTNQNDIEIEFEIQKDKENKKEDSSSYSDPTPESDKYSSDDSDDEILSEKPQAQSVVERERSSNVENGLDGKEVEEFDEIEKAMISESQQQLRSSNESQQVRSSNESQQERSSNESQQLRSSNESQQVRSSNESQQLRSSKESQQERSSPRPKFSVEQMEDSQSNESQQERSSKESQQLRSSKERQQERSSNITEFSEEQMEDDWGNERHQERSNNERQQLRSSNESQQGRSSNIPEFSEEKIEELLEMRVFSYCRDRTFSERQIKDKNDLVKLFRQFPALMKINNPIEMLGSALCVCDRNLIKPLNVSFLRWLFGISRGRIPRAKKSIALGRVIGHTGRPYLLNTSEEEYVVQRLKILSLIGWAPTLDETIDIANEIIMSWFHIDPKMRRPLIVSKNWVRKFATRNKLKISKSTPIEYKRIMVNEEIVKDFFITLTVSFTFKAQTFNEI